MRPSGTEPKIKFYIYSVQDSRKKALSVNRRLKEEILESINEIE
jgi:phosphoglucomutase